MAEEVGSFCGDAVEAVADVNGLYIGNDLILIFQFQSVIFLLYFLLQSAAGCHTQKE